MRLLHTSDWHLGRTLSGVDLLDHQRAFADFLVDLVRERAVEVVVVAGDVYDRAIPNVEAVAILSDTLARLAQHAHVIVTSGNHDSPVRLGFGAALMRERIHVHTDISQVGVPALIDKVAFYPLPYLDPDLARAHLSSPSQPWVRSHGAVMARALERVRADWAGRPSLRSVVIAHAFVTGGTPCESERDIQVGGVASVPASLFDGFDYVALGHLHGAQRIQADVGQGTHMRYAGSPLAFSFSEVKHTKSVALVDLDPTGPARVELIPTPVPRRLAIVAGTVAEVLGEVGQAHRDAWVRLDITDVTRPPELGRLLKEHFPHLLQMRFTSTAARASTVPVVRAGTSPVQVATEFMTYATGDAPTPAEVKVLADALTAATKAGAT